MCRPPMAGYLDSFRILNSVARSSEPSLASFSLPRCETFGLCATVISTAFPRLALSPGPEGKAWYPVWPLEAVYLLYHRKTSITTKQTVKVAMALNVDSPFPWWLDMTGSLNCFNIHIQLLLLYYLLFLLFYLRMILYLRYRRVFGSFQI